MDELITKERKDYKCYTLLKELYSKNNEFKNYIDEGIKLNKVFPFEEELWIKLDNQNFRYQGKFTDYFEEGNNIGNCTVFSKQISYSFTRCLLYSGIIPILKGTYNCKDGVHCWMESDGYVYDTSLMIKVSSDYYSKLIEKIESKINPNEDSLYSATKEFTNDKSLKR